MISEESCEFALHLFEEKWNNPTERFISYNIMPVGIEHKVGNGPVWHVIFKPNFPAHLSLMSIVKYNRDQHLHWFSSVIQSSYRRVARTNALW